MSDYAVINATIDAWVKNHQLALFTEYKDSEVRSVDVVGGSGKRFQIWIDSPEGSSIAVHVWNYKKLRKDWNVALANLAPTLEDALATALAWGQQ